MLTKLKTFEHVLHNCAKILTSWSSPESRSGISQGSKIFHLPKTAVSAPHLLLPCSGGLNNSPPLLPSKATGRKPEWQNERRRSTISPVFRAETKKTHHETTKRHMSVSLGAENSWVFQIWGVCRSHLKVKASYLPRTQMTLVLLEEGLVWRVDLQK